MKSVTVRLMRSVALVLPVLAALAVAVQAQAPAPAPNPQLAAAQASFEALPEAERKAIQTDLIWTGHFNGAVSGTYGPLTFRAVNALKAGQRGAPDGVLTPVERRALAQAAQASRDAAGFRLLTDERTGARIGVPTRLLPKRDVTPSGGSRWQSEDGRVTLDTSSSPPGEALEPLFERATAANANIPGRKITYKLLRPDFFVVTGETATGRFYRRLASGPAGLRGFSIGYDKALAPNVDKLVIAIAASFEPFPTGPAPAQPAAIAATPGATVPAAAPVAPRAVERGGVGLAVSPTQFVTSSAALEGCRGWRVGGREARQRLKDEASGLVLFDVEGARFTAVPGLRGEAPAAGEAMVVLAFGDDGGRRVGAALPGAAAAGGVLAPLQPGQAGAGVFDRKGGFVGIVTTAPAPRELVAGVAPTRRHGVAGSDVVAGLTAKAGLTLPGAVEGPELSTGGVVSARSASVVALSCAAS